MTEALTRKICTPCRGDIPAIEANKAGKLLAQVPEWELVDNATWLRRNFSFDNFRQTLDFVKEVGELAETESHHPVITFGWGFCRIDTQTRKIGGLHENDFILAAKIDQIPD